MSHGREPSQIFSTIDRYTEAVSRAVHARGGTVVEFGGDGMMVVFGAPREIERKEEAAVLAADAILVEMRRLEAESGEWLEVAIGIATGPAFVGSLRAADRLIWSAIGETTNKASRLQHMTREADVAVLLDEATWAGAGPLADRFIRLGGVSIRGIREPCDLYAMARSG